MLAKQDSDLFSLMPLRDICATIDNSELTKRISRLKPSSLIERPKTQSNQKKLRIKYKIIPELRAAVDILKCRLKEIPDEKQVSRPCTRLKVERTESVSPASYHIKSVSHGGHEFSRVPRLDDSIFHQISSLVRQRKGEKIEKYEKNNKEIVKDIEKFQFSLKEKTKKHNQEVARISQHVKTRKIEESQQKKNEYLYRTENIRWKGQYRDAIFKSKTLWAQLLLSISVCSTLNLRLAHKKVTIKKVKKFIRFLRMMSKILGMFMVLLRRKRKYIEYKIVRGFTQPIIAFIDRESKVFERIVSKYVWKMVNSNHLVLFLAFFKRSVRMVQRAFRRYLKIRDARIVVLMKMYSKMMPTPAGSRRVSLNTVGAVIGLGITAQKRKHDAYAGVLKEFIYGYLKKNVEAKEPLLLFSHPEKLVALISAANKKLEVVGKLRKRNTDIFIN